MLDDRIRAEVQLRQQDLLQQAECLREAQNFMQASRAGSQPNMTCNSVRGFLNSGLSAHLPHACTQDAVGSHPQ